MSAPLRPLRPLVVALALLPLLAGCGDPVQPNLSRELVAGSYLTATLSFDPTGSIGPVSVLAVLEERDKSLPVLTLLEDGRLQLLFEDPDDPLDRLVEGSYLTTPDGVRLDFGPASVRGELLLPRILLLTREDDGDLVAETVLEDGVPRATLFGYAPELEGEPLTDPIPGSLTIRFVPE